MLPLIRKRSWTDALAPRTDDAGAWDVYNTILRTKWEDIPCLGPIDSWPVYLQVLTSLVLSNTFPAAIYWGEEHNMLYNAAYVRDIALKKHPWLMGTAYRVGWKEVWDNSDSLRIELCEAYQTGVAVHANQMPYFVSRGRGFQEEAYFSYTLAPVITENGKTGGLYVTVLDTTTTVISERQNKLVQELGEITTVAESRTTFFDRIRQVFDAYHFDTPLFTVYVPDRWRDDSTEVSNDNVTYVSQASVGLRPAGAVKISVSRDQIAAKSNDGDAWSQLVRQAVYSKSAVSATEELRADVCMGRAFNETCSHVRVIPYYLPSDTVFPFVIIVVGVNSRHPFTEIAAAFHGAISHLIVLGLAELKRGEEAALLESKQQKLLEAELAKRTEEVIKSERRFTKMASVSPSGIFQAERNGKIIFANEAWYELTGCPMGSDPNSWALQVHPDDVDIAQAFSLQVVEGQENGKMVFRWIGDHGVKAVSVSIVHYDECIYGTLTDVTEQINAREVQKARADDAEQNKRQQESFLDFTSHELRNPLSAIVGSCDFLIEEALQHKADLLKLTEHVSPETAQAISSIAEKVGSNDDLETIVQCTMHMKNVIGDVLMISKLEGNHMQLNLSPCKPLEEVEAVLGMFHREMESKGIHCSLKIDSSWPELQTVWALLDAGRFKQILINLINNAIKFSQHSKRKEICAIVSASKVDENSNRRRIFVSIKDYGCGMTEVEQTRLFAKFSQGSPRTHVKYGGSGLGLHICRLLANLMGGEITCESTAGSGSIFKFSIQFEAIEGNDPRVTSLSVVDGQGLSDETPVQIPSTFPKTEDCVQEPAEQRLAATNMNTPEPMTDCDLSSSQRAKITILLVEDNLINQKILAKQLRKTGRYELLIANHGLEALTIMEKAQLEGTPIDVCLCDIEMPVCNGIECVQRVRTLEKAGTFTSRLPFIACSANARPVQIASMLEAGMDTTLSKPFRLSQVEDKIEQLLSKMN